MEVARILWQFRRYRKLWKYRRFSLLPGADDCQVRMVAEAVQVAHRKRRCCLSKRTLDLKSGSTTKVMEHPGENPERCSKRVVNVSWQSGLLSFGVCAFVAFVGRLGGFVAWRCPIVPFVAPVAWLCRSGFSPPGGRVWLLGVWLWPLGAWVWSCRVVLALLRRLPGQGFPVLLQEGDDPRTDP